MGGSGLAWSGGGPDRRRPGTSVLLPKTKSLRLIKTNCDCYKISGFPIQRLSWQQSTEPQAVNGVTHVPPQDTPPLG